jgi:hypothetical protein
MTIDRNDGEGNCLNQMAGILEEYASPEFVEALLRGPLTEVFNLNEQRACFYDFYEPVLRYAQKRSVDVTSLEAFAALLDATTPALGVLRHSDYPQFLRSSQWKALQEAALRPLALLRSLPKYSREWCDAMRANRMDPRTSISADGFRVPDGFFE